MKSAPVELRRANMPVGCRAAPCRRRGSVVPAAGRLAQMGRHEAVANRERGGALRRATAAAAARFAPAKPQRAAPPVAPRANRRPPGDPCRSAATSSSARRRSVRRCVRERCERQPAVDDLDRRWARAAVARRNLPQPVPDHALIRKYRGCVVRATPRARRARARRRSAGRAGTTLGRASRRRRCDAVSPSRLLDARQACRARLAAAARRARAVRAARRSLVAASRLAPPRASFRRAACEGRVARLRQRSAQLRANSRCARRRSPPPRAGAYRSAAAAELPLSRRRCCARLRALCHRRWRWVACGRRRHACRERRRAASRDATVLAARRSAPVNCISIMSTIYWALVDDGHAGRARHALRRCHADRQSRRLEPARARRARQDRCHCSRGYAPHPGIAIAVSPRNRDLSRITSTTRSNASRSCSRGSQAGALWRS